MDHNEDAKKLFREKSLDRISSPEDLKDYIRVANPGAWFILTAVVILLIGMIVWSVCGSIESTVDAVCITEDGNMVCYVGEENIERIRPEMTVRLSGGSEYIVKEIGEESENVNTILSDYAIHLGNFTEGEWVYPLVISGETVADGTAAAEVIVDSIHPIRFILG